MFRVDHTDSLRSVFTCDAELSMVTEFCDDDSLNSSCCSHEMVSVHDSSVESFDEITVHTQNDSMIYKNPNALCDDLRFITEMPEMCDVKFLVGVDKVPMYGVKAILAARSRAFYNLIAFQQKISKNCSAIWKRKTWMSSKLCGLKNRKPTNCKHHQHVVIPIEEFEPDIFKLVILYLHTGKTNVNVKTVIGVMNAADSYGLDDLRSACHQFALNSIKLSTVLPLLATTETYVIYKWTNLIRAKIMEFIGEKAQDVLRLPEFDYLSKKTAVLIFLRPELKATEETKWNAALRWSRRHCHQQETNFLRRTLKLFSRRINFSNIPLYKLTDEINPLGVLRDDVIERAMAHQSSARLVIGQDREPIIAPQKPPRNKKHARRAAKSLASAVTRGSLFGGHFVPKNSPCISDEHAQKYRLLSSET